MEWNCTFKKKKKKNLGYVQIIHLIMVYINKKVI